MLAATPFLRRARMLDDGRNPPLPASDARRCCDHGDDGGSWDLGYPRVVERAPGELLTVYYMNRRDDPVQMNGGVRHIAQTVFDTRRL